MNAAGIRRVFKKRKAKLPKTDRQRVTGRARVLVRRKTGGKCHFCGGSLGGRWQADHVVPLRLGGKNKASNYLPICAECNRLRWAYRPAVVRLALRFGLYAKQEIRNRTALGELLLKFATRGPTQAVSRLSASVVAEARRRAKKHHAA